MKDKLCLFQEHAIYGNKDDAERPVGLRQFAEEAIHTYEKLHIPQIISFTAPTGAGKTIIMSALMEDIYCGDDYDVARPNSIFIWISGSPQLNEQSRDKIDAKADKIRIGQCVIITDETFDQEVLDDGHIYFLNTQKLAVSSNLTKHSDHRTYTIWETLANTIEEKSDHLYVIMDEAHCGMLDGDVKQATSIMQKFIKGFPKDGLPPMPVVIGMSATIERFDNLIKGIASKSYYSYAVTPDEVKSSGLLKDRIIITYPENETNNEMAILQAAAENWKDKWDRWQIYCQEQHEANVNPIFVIQVTAGKGNHISETNLDDCLQKIEDSTGFRFEPGEVVHTFGDTNSSITVNGLEVRYAKPSGIADDKKIKVVFFKENLSTGWDCPRAETMMSFCSRHNATYIAQLLGRMIRNPLQRNIKVDDVLNDVHLYLPYFDKNTVKQIVDGLRSSEGGDVPTDVYGEELGEPEYDILTCNPGKPGVSSNKTQSNEQHEQSNSSVNDDNVKTDNMSGTPNHMNDSDTDKSNSPDFMKQETYDNEEENELKTTDIVSENIPDLTDRQVVARFINDSGIPTYHVRKIRTSGSYLKSLYDLAHLLSQSGLYAGAVNDINQEIVNRIHDFIEKLKSDNQYDKKVNETIQFKLQDQVFDMSGKSVDNNSLYGVLTSTDTDIERQYRHAENKLCNEGVGEEYGKQFGDWHNPDTFEIEVILFVNDQDAMKSLNSYAEDKFHDLKDKYRRSFKSKMPEKYRHQYEKIVKDGDTVSELNFTLPEDFRVHHDVDGKQYSDHLFVDNDTGVATFKFNTWEDGVIEEEEKRDDFLYWIRNPEKAVWSLAIPYEKKGETHLFYPDFLIVRKGDNDSEYIVDILDPHNKDFDDNVGKAVGLAKYAEEYNPCIGRVQLIRKMKDSTGKYGFSRLDVSKSAIREKVLRITTQKELEDLFETDGIFT